MAIKANKRALWLKHFLNDSNTKTFLQRTASARAAGYRCTSEDSFRVVGNQNFTILQKDIEKWLDEYGLSESALKIKLLDLLEAKETVFKPMKGAVNLESLGDNVSILAISGSMNFDDEDGEAFGAGDTLLAIEVENKELQRRTLDMAIKVRGMYAAEKRDHTVDAKGNLMSYVAHVLNQGKDKE